MADYIHLSSWIIIYFRYYPKMLKRKTAYFGTRPGVVHSGCDVLFPLWCVVMSPWENSSWEFSLCPDWQKAAFKLDVDVRKTGFSIKLSTTEYQRNNANCEGEGSLPSSSVTLVLL